MANGGDKPVLLSIPREQPVRETEKARGISIEGVFVWIPKSLSRDFEENEHFIAVWVPQWLVEAKSLESFVDTSYEPTLF